MLLYDVGHCLASFKRERFAALIDLNELSLMCKDLKLLYVEDDDKIRKTTLRLLRNFFDNVTVAIDGRDGFEKFKAGKFDLIISDIRMPNVSGLDMISLIREEDQDISILLISAHVDGEYFTQAIELAIDAYLVKPLVRERFVKTLYKTVKKIKALAFSNDYHRNLEEEVKRRNADMERELNFDALTTLYSRYSFFKDIKAQRSPVILLIDIDKFKVINEVYGSEIGSKVLQKFSVYLGLSVDDESCKLYRLSADEFAIVDGVGYIDTEKYEFIIEKLFKNLDNLTIEIDGNKITIDITIGISTVEENGYENAKIALDYAKKRKKRFMMYSSAIDHRKESASTLKCRDDIALAIDEKRVVAVYQPIVDAQGRVLKYEILMRLQEQETLKLLTPYYFLDVAFKTRLYEQLSSTIVFKALSVLSATDKTLSVNFTYSDVRNSAFIGEVEDFFISHEGIGKRAVFEIVENENMENYEDMKKFIKRFRKYGVKIAIDDFGSGFSNFEHILELKPDYLKIDGSLVKNIDADERSYTLVAAIVEFSHKLGIKVIAEYVRNETIFEMLKVLDVDEYQGYYFSEPLESIEEK